MNIVHGNYMLRELPLILGGFRSEPPDLIPGSRVEGRWKEFADYCNYEGEHLRGHAMATMDDSPNKRVLFKEGNATMVQPRYVVSGFFCGAGPSGFRTDIAYSPRREPLEGGPSARRKKPE